MATYIILSRVSPEAFQEPKDFKKAAEAVSAKIRVIKVLGYAYFAILLEAKLMSIYRVLIRVGVICLVAVLVLTRV